ncbi:MAG: hypothetical protein B7Z12_05795 [Caulobacter vibrioides]|uniref:Uncharacterized protein n=1 Tax=Caulobacter vibrioides TaxID=155892 RepID=A0A258DA90_CAUVI|nr:MAG: hypothetical protein B7Z12_05795 [Caulobacter vibrioides]
MSQAHYELFVRRRAGAQWTLEIATENRLQAIQAAEDALEQGRAVAVRVSKETHDAESGEYRSVAIFTKGDADGGKSPKEPSDRAPLCVEPADLYNVHARDRIGRLLEGWLTRHKATPFELLHRPDLVEKLDASGNDLQHALQKIAVPEAQARGQSVHEVIRHFQGLVERTIADLMRAFRKGVLPDLDKEGFSNAAKRLVDDPDRAFLLGAGVAASIAPAKSWSDKIVRLLDLAAAAPQEPTARAIALEAIELPLVEIVGSKAGMADLLNAADADLGDRLAMMIRLTGGVAVQTLIQHEASVRACMPELPDAARRLSDWLTVGEFTTVRKAIATLVLTELNGVRRLKPADAEAEIEFLRALAMSLMVAAGGVLQGEDIQIAFSTRSKSLLSGGFIDALLGHDRSAYDEIRMLIRLAENVIGASSKRQAAKWIIANIGNRRLEDELRKGPGSPMAKLTQLAGLQRSLGRSGLAREDLEPLCAKLGEIGDQIETETRFLTMVSRAPAPLGDRLSLLVKLAMGETGPTGAVADKARSEALKLIRDPSAQAQLAKSPQTLDLMKALLQRAA